MCMNRTKTCFFRDFREDGGLETSRAQPKHRSHLFGCSSIPMNALGSLSGPICLHVALMFMNRTKTCFFRDFREDGGLETSRAQPKHRIDLLGCSSIPTNALGSLYGAS